MLSGSHTVGAAAVRAWGGEGRACRRAQRRTLVVCGSPSPPPRSVPAPRPARSLTPLAPPRPALTPRPLASSQQPQLGSKGYGDPVTFDNTYYKTLLDKPWERMSADMAAHIGGLGEEGVGRGGQAGQGAAGRGGGGWGLGGEEGRWRAGSGGGSRRKPGRACPPARRRAAPPNPPNPPAPPALPLAHVICSGIPTDHVLPDDPPCRPLIERYAADQRLFFADFAAAYARMSELGARWA